MDNESEEQYQGQDIAVLTQNGVSVTVRAYPIGAFTWPWSGEALRFWQMAQEIVLCYIIDQELTPAQLTDFDFTTDERRSAMRSAVLHAIALRNVLDGDLAAAQQALLSIAVELAVAARHGDSLTVFIHRYAAHYAHVRLDPPRFEYVKYASQEPFWVQRQTQQADRRGANTFAPPVCS